MESVQSNPDKASGKPWGWRIYIGEGGTPGRGDPRGRKGTMLAREEGRHIAEYRRASGEYINYNLAQCQNNLYVPTTVTFENMQS